MHFYIEVIPNLRRAIISRKVSFFSSFSFPDCFSCDCVVNEDDDDDDDDEEEDDDDDDDDKDNDLIGQHCLACLHFRLLFVIDIE